MKRKFTGKSYSMAEGWTRLYSDGTSAPQCWYHDLFDAIRDWWKTRDWRAQQRQSGKRGARYYGASGTIHQTGLVNVEVKPKPDHDADTIELSGLRISILPDAE